MLMLLQRKQGGVSSCFQGQKFDYTWKKIHNKEAGGKTGVREVRGLWKGAEFTRGVSFVKFAHVLF